MPAPVYNILVLYYTLRHPLRATIRDHLYALRDYTPHRCHYVNLAVQPLPRDLAGFDLIVLHNTILSRGWNPQLFEHHRQTLQPVRDLPGVKVMLPQDEFLGSDQLTDWIREFGIDVVFSVAPESEWPVIYPDVDRQRVRFVQVLTGYLSDATVAKIDELAAAVSARDIDVGYRAWEGSPWLGRFGRLKQQIAEEFVRAGSGRNLRLDVSTRPEDTLFGFDWYQFLLRCRYTIGVEGGASLLDRDGSVKQRVEAWLQQHPGASFEDVERACFPGLDGNLRLFALSPRHLEACATRTCQILVEGDYNGILQPHRHYIPLRADFSNLQDVLDVIAQDSLRAEIVARAWEEIVGSGRYTYRAFADTLIGESLGDRQPLWQGAAAERAYRRALRAERRAWRKVRLLWGPGRKAWQLVRRIPLVTPLLRRLFPQWKL